MRALTMVHTATRSVGLVGAPIAVAALVLIWHFQLAAQPRSDESNPVLAAAIGYGQKNLMEYLQGYCAKEDPKSSDSIAAAMKTWLDSHSRLYLKASQILQSTYSEEERAELTEGLRSDNEKRTAKMAAVSPDERVSKCRAFTARIPSPEWNLLQRPALVSAIESFRG